MDVSMLNDSQIDFLKWDYFYSVGWDHPELIADYMTPYEIPVEIILEYYSGVCFVPEDFGSAE